MRDKWVKTSMLKAVQICYTFYIIFPRLFIPYEKNGFAEVSKNLARYRSESKVLFGPWKIMLDVQTGC